MRQLHLKVLKNKDLVCTNGAFVLGNKGDNNTTKINITCDETLLQYNNFLILETPAKDHKYCCPLLNMEFIITSTICNLIGEWGVTFLSTSQEDVSDENIDYSQAIMVSNAITGVVNDSVIDDKELETLPVDPNMQIIYNDLMTLRNDLNTLIEDNPNIANYIEVQEELKIIEEMISNIKIDVGEVTVDNTEVLAAIEDVKNDVANINIDLSPISTKLDDLDIKVSNIPTSDYSDDLGQIKSTTSDTKGMVISMNNMIQTALISNTNSIKSNTELTSDKVTSLDNKVGNNETKEDGTLFNYAFWNLERTMETKGISQSNNTILQAIHAQMSDANTITDEILE